MRILFLGDCNTLGVNGASWKPYPEIVADSLDAECINRGYTMSTTREGVELSKQLTPDDYDFIVIQYGLVDSWMTFRYSPYVLYYPDNRLRKAARKLVKLYKKAMRLVGANSLLGEKHVVPIDEYMENLHKIINAFGAHKTILIETAPTLDKSRNKNIKLFNHALDKVSKQHNGTRCVLTYKSLESQIDSLLIDDVHFNEKGTRIIAGMITSAIMEK